MNHPDTVNKKRYGLLVFLVLSANLSIAQTAYPDSSFTEYFRRTSGWTGGDATLSIALPDGRSMWLFGDSYINNYQVSDNTLPCLFQVRNCITVTEAGDPSQMTTYLDETKSGVEQTYFKIGQVGNTVYWPGHGFVRKDTVFVFLEKYSNTNLAFLGNYLARILLPDFELLGMTALPAMNGLNMGKAVVFDEATGYFYVYGNKLNWIVQEPYVARAKFKNLVSGNWRFYNGSSWVKNPSKAKKICDDRVSPGFSVVKVNDTYHLVTQENGYLSCGLGREIYSYQSTLPEGKFTGQKTLYTIEDQINGNYLLTYNAQAHAQFLENDELLVSYNVNDWVDTLAPYVCPSECQNIFTDRRNADSYRPKFIRVPLSVLGLREVKPVPILEAALYPNPAGEWLHLAIPSSSDQSCQVSILDLSGRLVWNEQQLFSAGINKRSIDISRLQPQCYVVKIQSLAGHSGNTWKVKKFVKQ